MLVLLFTLLPFMVILELFFVSFDGHTALNAVTFGDADFFIAPHFVPISMDEMLDFLLILLLLPLFGLVKDAELTTIELLNRLVAPLLTYC